jgi:hypothetical protein
MADGDLQIRWGKLRCVPGVPRSLARQLCFESFSLFIDCLAKFLFIQLSYQID